MQQFARGCGYLMDWITDPALLQNAKLELDLRESLASSQVIGIFGSIMTPNILFQQSSNVGVYSSLSKEHLLLSQGNDFFAAGIEYSTYNRLSSPLTTEPSDEPLTPTSVKMDEVQPETLNSFINLPSNISIFPLHKKSEIPETPKQAPDSPSFFSPSFRDHLSSSNRYDPRIHTVNIPLHITAPTRSQSDPTTPSPVRNTLTTSSFSSIGRSSTSVRTVRRTSDIPPPNITAISPKELSSLLLSLSLLLVDIRAFAVYAKSRLVDAINICIPTVLLKRSSLSLENISESIVSRGDRGRFARWKEADGIVIYDTDSLRVKDSYPLTTLAAKFLEAGFKNPMYGLIGSLLYQND